jgi:hypothetical protein
VKWTLSGAPTIAAETSPRPEDFPEQIEVRGARQQENLMATATATNLHDLVADGEGRPEFFDLWFSSRIEGPLQ